MPFLIGTDEAGYGPNLGPLVITATVWHVDAPDVCDLYDTLRAVVCNTLPPIKKAASSNGAVAREPVGTGKRDGEADALAIADSKLLYKAGDSLAHLERGVLVMLHLLGCRPKSWGGLFQKLLDDDSLEELCALPWHREFELALPLDADGDDVVNSATRLRDGFTAARVRLVGIRSAAVFPARFNRLTGEYGNKAEVLSRTTVRLIAEALPSCHGAPTYIVCDKHGGRNYYGSVLQRQFPDPLIEVHGESPAVSVYRWTHEGQRIEARFQVGGESWLPAALASMVSKYLRELAMRAFNDYWCEHLPELRRTAGYPQDARRFKSDIAAKQATLGIDDAILWRAV